MTQAGLESAARPAQQPTRFPCFDGLRAVAAFAVLVTHVAFITGAEFRSDLGMFAARLDVGVAVFFVISGFLLYRPFVAARLAGNLPPRVAAYFWRRALRIFPAYWLALTITVFVLNVPERVPDTKRLFLFYGLFHQYSVGDFVGPILSSYTLVTELAFYVFLPVYAFVVGSRLGPRIRTELVALATLFGFGIAYRLAVGLADPAPQRDAQLQNIFPGWIDVFAAGMALAVLSAWIEHRRLAPPGGLARPWAPAAAWTLAALAFVAVSLVIGKPVPGADYSMTDEFAIHYLYLAVGVFLLLPAIFGPQGQGLIRRLLRNRAVQWLGLVSYGLYLWNETMIEKYLDWTDSTAFNTSFLPMLIGVTVLTAAISAASYYVLERPVLSLKKRVPARRSAAVSPT
jgi:peptidoglycan/LPS O-acetylase OafA/YrhL